MMGERIAFLRNRVGWSQSQLAKELHVSLKTVTNWERGDSDPSAKNIIIYAKFFLSVLTFYSVNRKLLRYTSDLFARKIRKRSARWFRCI